MRGLQLTTVTYHLSSPRTCRFQDSKLQVLISKLAVKAQAHKKIFPTTKLCWDSSPLISSMWKYLKHSINWATAISLRIWSALGSSKTTISTRSSLTTSKILTVGPNLLWSNKIEVKLKTNKLHSNKKLILSKIKLTELSCWNLFSSEFRRRTSISAWTSADNTKATWIWFLITCINEFELQLI